MANPSGKNFEAPLFSEMEYIFTKYYNETIAPIVSQQQRVLRQNQEQETRQRSDSGWGGYSDAVSPFATQQVSRETGTWNKASTDKLLEMIRTQLNSNGFKHDLQVMIDAWRIAAKKELGEDNYSRLSAKCPSGDLANDFVHSRVETLMLQQLGKSKVPKSSLEYILKKGFDDSIWGALMPTIKSNTEMDDKLNKTIDRMYSPNGLEKTGAAVLSFVSDSMAFSGTYTSALKTGGFLVFDVATRFAVDSLEDAPLDQQLGDTLFGNKNVWNQFRADAKKVKPSSSAFINIVNSNLTNKMKVPEYHPAYSPSRVNQLSMQVRGATDDGLQHLSNIESLYKEFALSYKKGGSYPSWMEGKSQEECIRLSSQFFAIATEMKSSGKKSMKVGSQVMTLEEVSQRGYDYGRAAAAKQQTTNAAKKAEVEKQHTPQQSFAAASVQQSQQQFQQYAAQQQNVVASQGNMQQQNTRQQQITASVNSWSGLMNQLGLSGFGDVGHNLGYVLSMLPDMLIGMFTGKTESLKLKDNMFPLAAIFAGMFVKNPILKMMLIGLGGANLLNKAGHEAMERDGVIQKPTRYREYPNELLDPRIENPAMKGYSLVATIDGVPSSITIDERTADAYYKGKIPLNTLCNAVLRKYDEQYEAFNQNYVQRLDDAEDRTLSRGIK